MMLKAFFISLLLSFSANAKTLNINTEKSSLNWTGFKVASKHLGSIPVSNGKLTYEKGMLKSGEVTAEVAKMTNSDLSGKWHKKLLDHLASDDFFSTAKYKTAKLVMEKVEKSKDKQYKITGKLTIKGVTKPISFPANIEFKDDVLEAKGTMKFDRTLYGIEYNSDKFFESLGDKLIKDIVHVDFHIVAK